MSNLFKSCSCPLCAQKYDIEDNLSKGSVFECHNCHAQLSVDVVGDYFLLNLIRGVQLYPNDYPQLKRCENCPKKDYHIPNITKDSAGIEFARYGCKLDISDSPDSVPDSEYRYYCNKQEDLVLMENISQVVNIDEIKNHGLQVISRSLKQTETILGIVTWYTRVNNIQAIINDSIESRFEGFYVKHKAIIHIKIVEKGIVVDVHSDTYDWKHCMGYYSFCKMWNSILRKIFDSIFDKDTLKNIASFETQKSKDVPGVSDIDVYFLSKTYI